MVRYEQALDIAVEILAPQIQRCKNPNDVEMLVAASPVVELLSRVYQLDVVDDMIEKAEAAARLFPSLSQRLRELKK